LIRRLEDDLGGGGEQMFQELLLQRMVRPMPKQPMMQLKQVLPEAHGRSAREFSVLGGRLDEIGLGRTPERDGDRRVRAVAARNSQDKIALMLGNLKLDDSARAFPVRRLCRSHQPKRKEHFQIDRFQNHTYFNKASANTFRRS
jgi:hypothetical protein